MANAAGVGMNKDIVLRYIELQALMLAPVAPHWAEYVWLEVLKKVSLVSSLLLFSVWLTTTARDDPLRQVPHRPRTLTLALRRPSIRPQHIIQHPLRGRPIREASIQGQESGLQPSRAEEAHDLRGEEIPHMAREVHRSRPRGL